MAQKEADIHKDMQEYLFGGPKTNKKKNKTLTLAEISKAFYNAGFSSTNIAEALNVDHTTVLKWSKQSKNKPKPPI